VFTGWRGITNDEEAVVREVVWSTKLGSVPYCTS
jgi:hypothetical protein